MSTITKSVQRLHKDLSKKIAYAIIEKIQDQSLTEEQIMEIVENVLQTQEKTKKGRSGYNLFNSEKSKELKDTVLKGLGIKDRSQKISTMWKALSQEEKDIYNTRAKEVIVEQKKMCTATKANGDACTHRTKNDEDFCGQHMKKTKKEKKLSDSETSSQASDEPKKCIGITKTGAPCKSKVVVQDYCKRHAKVYNISEEESDTLPTEIQIGSDTATLLNYNDKQYYRGNEDDIVYHAHTRKQIGFWDADDEAIAFD